MGIHHMTHSPVQFFPIFPGLFEALKLPNFSISSRKSQTFRVRKMSVRAWTLGSQQTVKEKKFEEIYVFDRFCFMCNLLFFTFKCCKKNMPGASSRDLFIPKRWVGHVYNLSKWSRFHSKKIPKRSRLAPQNCLVTFHYTGCLIGILLPYFMVSYNHHITG